MRYLLSILIMKHHGWSVLRSFMFADVGHFFFGGDDLFDLFYLDIRKLCCLQLSLLLMFAPSKKMGLLNAQMEQL